MINGILRFFATAGPIGYLPASGTLASLCMIPCIYGIQLLLSDWYYGVFVIVVTVASWYIIERTCRVYDLHDDPSIVLDEIVGMLVVCWNMPWCIDIVILSFLLFRLFDITKITGINYAERLPGAFGIMADDIGAALYTKMLIALYMWLAY